MASSILRKIEKLLALAERGDFHEAANAAAKAKAIADKYNIAIEILKKKGADGYLDKIIDYRKTYGEPFMENLVPWELVLSKVVAENHGCRVFQEGNSLNIAGKSSDIELVQMLFSWLRAQMGVVIMRKSFGTISHDDYIFGMIHHLNKRMEIESKKERGKLKRTDIINEAIVRVDSRLNDVDKFLKNETFMFASMKPLCEESFYQGYEDGKNISLRDKKEIGNG